MRRTKDRLAQRRVAGNTGRNTVLALACAAAIGLPSAHAQETVPPGDESIPLPELAYDTYFEPFTDNPVYRIHQPEPFQPVEPLFKKFDPLDGLTIEAKVSRVTESGLGISILPIMTAKVGDKIQVPVLFQNLGPIPAYVFRMNYDPTRLRATGVTKANWDEASMDFNVHPDRTTPERRVFVVQYSADPWTPTGPAVTIGFDVIAAGDANLTIEDVDVSDEGFNNAKMVAHDGLVRIAP